MEIEVTDVDPAKARRAARHLFWAGFFLAAWAILASPSPTHAAECTFVDDRYECVNTDGDPRVTRGSFGELPDRDEVIFGLDDRDVFAFDVHLQLDESRRWPRELVIDGAIHGLDFVLENGGADDLAIVLAGELIGDAMTVENGDRDYAAQIAGVNYGYIVEGGGLGVLNHSENGSSRSLAFNGGLIETVAPGAVGMAVVAPSVGGTALNRGALITRGETSGTSSAHAIFVEAWNSEAVNEGDIETFGGGANGMLVSGVFGGVRNDGAITTRGRPAGESPAHAIAQYLWEEGVVFNTWEIETLGAGARGIHSSVGSGEIHNHGAITTRGAPDDGASPADAMYIQGRSTGSVSALNTGTISTEGAKAAGLKASVRGAAGAARPGTATATNEAGGSVTTAGAGVVAEVREEAGTAVANNHGMISTTGDMVDGSRAYGVYARVSSSTSAVGGEARALNSGAVETRGTGARGVRASVEGPGTAVAVNEGSVTTAGGPDAGGFAAHGVDANADLASGTARATNEAGATITTTGAAARGMQATAGNALATNNGVVFTTGDAPGADGATFGVLAYSESTQAGHEARAVNHGTVETRGAKATGVSAIMQGSGTAAAVNEGTIVTRGGTLGASSGANGMYVAATDATASVTNRGTIAASGPSAVGMYADASGAGTAEIVLDGGTVRASHDSATDDTEDGVGILGLSESGTITARIERGAMIEAPVAARFSGGPADVMVDASTIIGTMEFDRFDDTLSAMNSRFSGDIDFGDGMNTLVVQSSVFDGAVSGVSDLFVRGGGIARFNSDVTFAGSSATIEEGTLMFAGHFNLGAEGTMTVHDSARVTALVTAANLDDPPQITAGGGIVAQDAAGSPAELAIYVQPDASVDEATRGDQATLQRVAQNVISEDTPVMAAGNQVTLMNEGQGGATETIGTIAIMDDGSRGSAEVRTGAVLSMSDQDAGAGASCAAPGAGTAAAGGTGVLLGALLHAGVDLFDLEAGHQANPYGKSKTTAAYNAAASRKISFNRSAPAWTGRAGWTLTNWTSGHGNGSWTRVLGANRPALTAGTPAVGFEARFGGNFSIDVSGSRDISMSLQHKGMASQLDGSRYVVRTRWRGETLLAGASISRGQWRGHSAFANPVAGAGGLAGGFDMDQTHAQAGVGARLHLGGLRMQPSATLFSGRVERDAYTARGETFRASLPGTAHSYRGLSGALRLSSSGWLNAGGAVRWRPAMELNATRTHGTAAAFTLQQTARTGALSFTSLVQGDSMPGTVYALGVSVDAVISERLRLNAGYTGMLVDDELKHGVAAGLKVLF